MSLVTEAKNPSSLSKKESDDVVDFKQIPLPVKTKSARRRYIYIILAVGMAFLLWRAIAPRSSVQGSGTSSERGSHGEARAPVPIVAGTSQTQDFPIYLNALGTVQAYNNVTVHVQVNGEVQNIYFQEGKNVKKGDVIAQIDSAPYQAAYDQAVAKKAEDAAQLANAQLNLNRDQNLLQKQVIDQQDFDTQRYTVAQLQATVQADQAAVESAKVNLDYTHITAPIDGIAGIRMVDQGNIVQATGTTSSIVVINQVQPIYVLFTLPQQDLRQVREALQGASLKVLAMSRDNETTLAEGTLTVLDNQIQTATATVNLKATFANTNDELWPGQFVNVRLLVDTKKNAIVVPSSAVQVGPDGSYVYQITSNMKVKMVPLQVGVSEDGWTLVNSGIDAGAQVVVDGQYRLQSNSTVTITKNSGSDTSSGTSALPKGAQQQPKKKHQPSESN